MAQNGDGNLRFWRTKKPSYLGSWCAPQPVAVFPLHGSKLTVASAGRHTMGATLTALRALHPRGVPTYPQLPVQHGGMPHLRFSRHSLWKGRSVSFTSYLFNVNTGKPGAILTLIRLFLDIIPLLVNDGDKSSFFKQSVGPSSTWACLISVRWSERGWHAFSHRARRSKICHKSWIYRWCSLGCFLYYSVVIRLLCFLYKFFYLTLFDILRSCFFLINFF